MTPDYFRAMGIPLLEGRTFASQDGAAQPKAVVVSRSFAERYLAGAPVLGQRLVMPWGDTLRGTVQKMLRGVIAREREYITRFCFPPLRG